MKNKFFFKENPVGTIFDQRDIAIVNKVLKSGEVLTRGKNIHDFEKKFSNYCGSKYAIAVSSCGAALNITSKMLSIKKGDEVICQANMFWSSINHLVEKKAKIKFADIDENLNISISHLNKIITKKTKAIYIMHHGGNPCDLDSLYKIARKFSVSVVEDCAHALGSKYKKNKLGMKSDIACFSFSTLKNISTLGEGGMIVTNNKNYMNKAKILRTNFPTAGFKKDLFFEKKFHTKFRDIKNFTNVGNSWTNKIIKLDEIGSTYRLSEPQAATGIIQLKKIDKLIKRRKYLANLYTNFLKKYSNLFSTIQTDKNSKNSYHLFSFLVKENKYFTRNQLANLLIQRGIEIKIRFAPLHFNNVVRYNKISNSHKKNFSLPNLERIWLKEQMSLPIDPYKSLKQINKMKRVFSQTIKDLINK